MPHTQTARYKIHRKQKWYRLKLNRPIITFWKAKSHIGINEWKRNLRSGAFIRNFREMIRKETSADYTWYRSWSSALYPWVLNCWFTSAHSLSSPSMFLSNEDRNLSISPLTRRVFSRLYTSPHSCAMKVASPSRRLFTCSLGMMARNCSCVCRRSLHVAWMLSSSSSDT